MKTNLFLFQLSFISSIQDYISLAIRSVGSTRLKRVKTQKVWSVKQQVSITQPSYNKSRVKYSLTKIHLYLFWIKVVLMEIFVISTHLDHRQKYKRRAFHNYLVYVKSHLICIRIYYYII